MEEYEEDIISEVPEYSPKSEFSKGKQVDDAVRKCIEERGKEMIAGYWNTTMDKNGLPIRTWIPDKRKIFISTVDALRSLLSPEIKRDKIFKEAEKKINEELSELWNNYVYEEKDKTIYKDDIGNLRVKWEKNGRSYLPPIDAVVSIQDKSNPSRHLEQRGLWNNNVNAYWDELVTVYDSLFAKLNELIDRLNYFKQAIRF